MILWYYKILLIIIHYLIIIALFSFVISMLLIFISISIKPFFKNKKKKVEQNLLKKGK